MVYINFQTLNSNLKKAIKDKSLKPDELKAVSAKMKAEHKKTFKIASIVMACFTVFIAIMMTIGLIGDKADSGAILFSLLIMIPAMALVWGIVWFTQIGIVKIQFNSTVKKSYPELFEEVKI